MSSRPAGLPETAQGVRALRLALAALTGLVAGGGVLTMGAGDVLAAYRRPELAASLPGNRMLASATTLRNLGTRPVTARDEAVAFAALRSSPAAAEALTLLALKAREAGDKTRASHLLAFSGSIGWHEQITQRQLYNAALEAGDLTRALRHADALLRQGMATTELFAQFDRGMRDPVFRSRLLPYFAAPKGWPLAYLASRAGDLPDSPLLEALTYRASHNRGLERSIAAPVLGRIAGQGRLQLARQVWSLVPGADGLRPGPLPWPALAPDAQPTLFDWELSEGLLTTGGAALERVSGAGTTPKASRLLAFGPGSYRLVSAQPAAWRWSVACGTQPVWPDRVLATDNRITIPAGCPVQKLTLVSASEEGEASLAPLRVEPAS